MNKGITDKDAKAMAAFGMPNAIARGHAVAARMIELKAPERRRKDWVVFWKLESFPWADCTICFPSPSLLDISKREIAMLQVAATPKSALVRSLARIRFLAKEHP